MTEPLVLVHTDLYPAFSLYNKDDQLSLVPTEFNCSSLYSVIGGTSTAEILIHRMRYALYLLEQLPPRHGGVMSGRLVGSLQEPSVGGAGKGGSLRQSPLRHVWKRWRHWQRGGTRIVFTPQGLPVEVDASPASCERFGVAGRQGQVQTAKGPVTILGATRHHLWYSTDTSNGALAWSMKAAREVLASRQGGDGAASGANAKWPHDDRDGASTASSGERSVAVNSQDDERSIHLPEGGGGPNEWSLVDDYGPETLAEWFVLWTGEMDAELGRFLTHVAESLRVTPFDLSYTQVYLPPAQQYPRIADLPISQVRARAALLLHVNIVLLPLFPFINLRQSNDESAPAFLLCRARDCIFTFTKRLLLGRLLKQTTTLSLKTETESTPHDIVKLAITLPNEAVGGVLPSDAHRGAGGVSPTTATPPPVFLQVACQIADLPATELRRVFSERAGASASSSGDESQDRAFQVMLESPSRAALLPASAQYRLLFFHLAREVTSPSLGLLAPIPTLGPSPTPARRAALRYVPDVDLIHPDRAPGAESGGGGNTPFCVDEGRLRLYRCLGQLMGVAIRTGVAFPLPLSDLVWRVLVGERAAPGEAGERGGDRDPDVAVVWECLSSLPSLGLTPENAAQLMPDGLKCVAPLSNGRVVEVVEGAPAVELSATAAAKLAELGRALRLGDCMLQVGSVGGWGLAFWGGTALRWYNFEGFYTVFTDVMVSSVAKECVLRRAVGAEKNNNHFFPTFFQVAAMYLGLVSVVPPHILPLFTGAEMERLVHGSGRSVIQVFRDHASYGEGCGAGHHAVQVRVSCPSQGIGLVLMKAPSFESSSTDHRFDAASLLLTVLVVNRSSGRRWSSCRRRRCARWP
jgi:hypothetical protein